MLDFNLLKDLYKINSHSNEEQSIREFIKSYLAKHFNNITVKEDAIGNLYITKGKTDFYATIVAHLDQVGRYKGKIRIFRHDNIIIGIGEKNQQVNLGADDKNGIWVALQALKYFPALKVAFFVGEEIGCVGSHACDMSFFDNSKFVIQCDRRNGGDFISRTSSATLCDDSFVSKELKEKYGYSDTRGLITDVETLKTRGLKVACCNLSCGYYNPHCETEFTNVTELVNCFNFVKEIIEVTPRVEHEYKPIVYNYVNYYSSAQSIPKTQVDNSFDDYQDLYARSGMSDYYDWILY